MKHVFESVKLSDLMLKNRLIRSATWEGIAARDGGISENAYSIYDELAKGGVGAIITGFTSVAENDRYFGGILIHQIRFYTAAKRDVLGFLWFFIALPFAILYFLLKGIK